MSRSTWKGPFLDSSIAKNKSSNHLKIWSRSSVIPEILIGEVVLVHNGKEFKRITVTRDKIGFKFGEFSFTRKMVSKIKSTTQVSLNKKKLKK